MKRISTLFLISILLAGGVAIAADLYMGAVSPTTGAGKWATSDDDLRPVGSFGLNNGAAPALPVAGNVAVYSDTNGNLHVIDYLGNDGQLIRSDVATSWTADQTMPNLRVEGVLSVGEPGIQTELYKGQTVTVAKTGGMRATVQGGINLASEIGGDVAIVVFPGVYAEQSLELRDGVSLIGVDRDTCIISMASTNYDLSDARTSALVAAPGDSQVANLTINNTRVSYPSVALATGWGWDAGGTSGKTINVRNVSLLGSNSDTLYMSGNNEISIYDSDIYSGNIDTLSIGASTPSGTYTVSGCRFETTGARGNAIYFAATGTLYSLGNEYWNKSVSDTGAFWFITTGSGTIQSIGDTFYDGATRGEFGDIINGVGSGSGWTLTISEAIAAGLNDPEIANLTVDATDTHFGEVDVLGDLEVTGEAVVGGNLTASSNILLDSTGGNLFATKLGDGAPWFHIENSTRTLRFGDGTSLASNALGYFAGALRAYSEFAFASSAQFGIEGPNLGGLATFAGNDLFAATNAFKIDGETPADGTVRLYWGTAYDTNLYRSAADTLATDDTFDAPAITADAATITGPFTQAHTAPFTMGTNGQTSGSGPDTVGIFQAFYTTQPVAGDGAGLMFRVDDGAQTPLIVWQGLLGDDSNEGYGMLATYPNGIYTQAFQFGGPTSAEGGDLTLKVDGAKVDAPYIYSNGTELVNSAGVINAPYATMSADPTTTFGIATKGYVDANTVAYSALYLETVVSSVPPYYCMETTIPSLPQDNVTVAGLVDQQAFAEWLGPEVGLGTATMPSGSYSVHFHADKLVGNETLQFHVEIYIRTALGVETLLATTETTTPVVIEQAFNLTISINETVIDPTDRLLLKFIANVSGVGGAPTGVIYVQGVTDARVEFPVTTGFYASPTQDINWSGLNVFENLVTFETETTFEENILVNTLLGDFDSQIFGTAAAPVLHINAGDLRAGINTAFPSAALDVVGNAEINGTLALNGSLHAEGPAHSYIIRNGLTSGAGPATVAQLFSKYTSTPSTGDAAVLSGGVDDGTQQICGQISFKKEDATNGKMELFSEDGGALTIAMTVDNGGAEVHGHLSARSLTVNDGGADADTRFEGIAEENLLFLDAGNDRAGIGTATPAGNLDVGGTGIATSVDTTRLFVGDSAVGASANARVGLIGYKTTTSTYVAGVSAHQVFNNAEAQDRIGQMGFYTGTGVDDGEIHMLVGLNGALVDRWVFDEAGCFRPSADGTQSIGSASFQRLDEFGVNAETISSRRFRDGQQRKFHERGMGAKESALLDNLQPVAFTRASTSTLESYGLIAEDVEATMISVGINPRECGIMTYDENDELVGIKYTGLIIPIMERVQEQQARIEELEAVNVDILARLDAIEAP